MSLVRPIGVAAVAGICGFLLYAVALYGGLISSGSGAQFGGLKQIRQLSADGPVNAVAFSSDGSQLAILSNFGASVAIYDAKSWTATKTFDRYGGGYSQNSVAFLGNTGLITTTPVGDYSQDSRYANTSLVDPRYSRVDMFALMQWDVGSAKVARYFPDVGYPPKNLPSAIHDALTFAVSPNGHLIAAVNTAGVLIFDARSGTLLRTLAVPTPPNVRADQAEALVFSPDNTRIAVGTLLGQLIIFDPNTGEQLLAKAAYEEGDYGVGAIAFSPNGSFLATGKDRHSNVSRSSTTGADIWRASDLSLIASLPGAHEDHGGVANPDPVRTISWSPSGTLLVVGDDATLWVWNVAQAKPALISEVPGAVYSTAFSPSNTLAVAGGDHVDIYQQ
jgi:WD40 repeat protein